MTHSPRNRTVLSCALLIVPIALGVTGCGGGSSDPLSAKPFDAAGQVGFAGSGGNRKADPDKPLTVSVKDTSDGGGRITDVTATDATGRFLRGELTADGDRWRSTAPLAAGAHYTVRVSTEDEDGSPGRETLGFDTAAADKLLRVRFGPDSGTYGVGQPVTAELSARVKGRKARAVVERSLRVASQPAVKGSWHWVDGKTLHYRPRDYWPAHARIEVTSALEGIKVGNGRHGGPSKPLKLRTGDRVEAITDSGSHQMTVFKNGEVLRSIPVTTGKPGFSTRNGVKVVLGRESFVRMRGTSIGISEGSSDSYDLPVLWATRVTWSGEYVHAAPWSVGSQGAANVSHGCTGMSTGNAHWFFNAVRVGDLVTVKNSGGETMTPFDNGFGDWNMKWKDWQAGSALTRGEHDGSDPADAARLRPQV
ncbi:L,D-transpeptidase [Streptomyces sp. H27-D2]|uniref:L,D-transpeptidase n=1 Tax=Streptomyces sp. H27-D2 TaxID=3046304 RepID=UPI002DB8B278|nr:Ig-like domain-containing protein [Streptomyces sp. H27-D2]MEC4019328.1 Ig-like domain-containing protein [Streptomyces sp. H27-D2]